MSRRVLLTSAAIALLFGLLFLAPGFPPVRQALLQRVVGALGNAGITLTYDGADGNAWRRIALSGATLTGHGADVHVDTLELAYHLPSLLGGELPIDVLARGVQGNLDLAGIERLVDQAVAPSGGGGVLSRVRVLLREIDLQSVAMNVENAPFTLPDATISNIAVAPAAGGLQLGATLTTAHGQVVADARLALPSYDLTGNVVRADVAVARQWWDGAVAGTASGPFSLRRGQFNADLTIQGGAIHQSGIDVTGISGTALMRYPRITADVTGTGLGGPVSASGVIDIAAQNYVINGNATSQLAQVATWLAEFYGLSDLPVGATGQAQAQARVTGWKAPRVEGTATAAGQLAGVPLNDLSATLDMVTKGPIRLGVNAQLGGGAVTASVAPSATGNALQVSGADISLDGLELGGFAPGGVARAVRAQLELGGTPDGTARLAWEGALAEHTVTVEVDGRLNGDGLQAFAAAVATPADGAAISATGAVVYANGNLDAGLSVTDLALPGMAGPVRVGLTAQGQLAELALAATLDGDQPVTLDLAVLQPGGAIHASDLLDVRGRVTGTLADGAVRNVSGTFGPVQVAGAVELSPLTADLSVSSEPVRVRVGSQSRASAQGQPLEGSEPQAAALVGTPSGTPAAAPADSNVGATLSVRDGRLLYANGELTVRAQALVTDAQAGTAVTADIERLDVAFDYSPAGAPTSLTGTPDEEAAAAATPPAPAAWRLEVQADDGVALFSIDSTGAPFRLVATGMPVYVGSSARPALVNAAFAPAPNGTYAVSAEVAAASSVAGLSVVNGATLVGYVDPLQRGLWLDGAVGSLPVAAQISWATADVVVTAQVAPPAQGETGDVGHTVTYTPSTGEWSLTGSGPLGPVLAELGVTAVNPHYAGALSYTSAAGYEGSGQVWLQQPVAATLELEGLGSRLDVHLQSELGGVPIEGTGTIDQPLLEAIVTALSAAEDDAPALLVDLGPLENIALDARGLRGAGEVPVQQLGPVAVGSVPWSLEFAWETTSGFLEADGEVLNVSLAAGEVHAAGSLGANVMYGGSQYRLSLWPGDRPGDRLAASDPAQVRVGATLTPVEGGSPVATVGGSLRELGLELDASLEELAAALPSEYRPAGTLRASGTVNLLDGATYQGRLTLTPAAAATLDETPQDVNATFSGTGSDFSLQVDGGGINVGHTPATALTDGRLTLTAQQADLGRFFPTGVGVVLDGSLSYGAAGWRGQLHAQAQAADLGSAAAVLTGQFSTLQLQLDGSGVGQGAFAATGTLLPQPNLSGAYSLWGGQVAGSLNWQESLTATVVTEQLELGEWLTVPSINALVSADLAEGAVTVFAPPVLPAAEGSTAAAPALIVSLGGGQLHGSVSLPAFVQGTEVVLSGEVGGSLSNPTLSARLSAAGSPAAELMTIEASLADGASIEALLSGVQLATMLPSGLAPALDYAGGDIEVRGFVDRMGRWQLTAGAPLTPAISTPNNQLGLALSARGQGSDYHGQLDFVNTQNGSTGTIAAAAIAGHGAAANASLDLGSIDWQLLGLALGVQLEVQGNGLLSVGTGPLSADLTLDLAGQVADHTVRLQGTAPDDLTLSVAGDTVRLNGKLDWSATAEGGGSAHLSGQLLGRPVNLDLAVEQGLAAGALEVRAADATLTAAMTTPPEGAAAGFARRFSIAADVPPGAWAPYGGAGTAHVSLTGSDWHLNDLTATLQGLLGPADQPDGVLLLALSGALAPGLDLSGSLESPRMESAAGLALHSSGGALTLGNLAARLEWRDLVATVTNLGGVAVSLAGDATSDDVAELIGALGPAGSPAANLSRDLGARVGPIDLRWSARAGWDGSLLGEATASWANGSEPFGLVATAEAGSLRVIARSRSANDHVELALLLPPDPWAGGAISGSLGVDVTTDQMLPNLWVPIRLRSTSQVAGTLLSPTLTGSVQLSGALEAAGTVEYAQGLGRLTAEGPELAVEANYDDTGLFAEAALRNMPLGQWVPQLDNGRLSLDARLAGEHLTVTDLRFETARSVVTGGASLRLGGADDAATARLTAALDANLNLSDLRLGDIELSGTVRGPMVVSATSLADLSSASIIANLAALRVRTPTLGWSVSGSLSLGGSLGDPRVNAEFYGDGDLNGNLNVSAQPSARVYELSSTLSLGQLATDLRVRLGSGTATASGTARYGDGVFVVGSQSGPGGQPELTVTGAGRFAGLSALVAGDLSNFTLGGSLAALNPGLQGHMHLTVDARARSWLAGSVTGVQLAGRELAPISISATTAGATVVVQSSDLRATVDPLTLSWTLAVNAFELGAGSTAPQLTVWATGAAAAASVNASLRADDYELAAEVRHDQNTTVLVEGTGFGGQLYLLAARNAGSSEWTGGGSLAGADLFGFAVDAQATVLGVGLVPQVVLSTEAHGGFSVVGNASVGLDGVTVDQLIQGEPLEQALRVQGRLLPSNDLTLSTLDLTPGATLTAASAERFTTSSVRLTGGPAGRQDDNLRATGRLQLGVGPAHVELHGAASTPELHVALAALPRVRAAASLPANDLVHLVSGVVQSGLTLHGEDAARGAVTLRPNGLSLSLEGLGVELAGVDLEASGTLSAASADVVGTLLVKTDLPVAERETGYAFPWQLSAANGVWQLRSSGPHGELNGTYGAVVGQLDLTTDLRLSDGRIVGSLGLQGNGLTGDLSIADVTLLSPELGALTIALEALVQGGTVELNSSLASEAGRVQLDGTLGLGGLLPVSVVGNAPTSTRLDARIRSLELADVPYVAERLPEVSGELNALVQLRDGFVLGQFVSQQIAVGDITTPLQLNVSGRPSELALDLQLRGAIGRAELQSGNLAGMLRFERFPLTLISTAVVGPSDFTADVTGVMRFDGPLSAPLQGYLRVATEEVRLERMGVTTLGNVTVTFEEGEVVVDRAEFEGLGAWSARGVLRTELFDFGLQAHEADFTPLLGLVPAFARLGVEAVGSFDLSVRGSAADPNISLSSPDLEVQVSGTRYRLENTALDLRGVGLTVESRVTGLRPVTGSVAVAGEALLSLNPFSLANTELGLTGSVGLGTFGTLTGVQGALTQLADGTPAVNVIGTMGQQPLTVSGTLAPLDLRATGSGVTLSMPGLLIDRAVVDADVGLVSVPGGVALSGSIVAEEVIVDPAVRSRGPTAPNEGEAAAASADADGAIAGSQQAETEPAEVEDGALANVEAITPPPSQPQAAGGGLAALSFDNLAIRAPGRVTLTTNVGSFEAGLDLNLTGTGADPRLAGTATAIRGNLRFGGRDFNITRAVATFTPNRGVYPELDVVANAEFDKQRVLSSAPNVSFAAPREGNSFDVQLAFLGPVEPADTGGFRFDVRPILTSNALIEVQGESMGVSAARPFTEAELMSLITLGRFELNAELVGAGGLGEAVATGVLDTAIDLLVVSGLENALREALGLDVVEIRTSSLTSLLDESGQPFGVSLRLGGYINPELFASYRIGTYDGSDPDFSVTNEVLLRYALGPLDLDFIARLDLPTAGSQGQVRPEIGVMLGYQLSPSLSLDSGVTIGFTRSKIEFGITIRW